MKAYFFASVAAALVLSATLGAAPRVVSSTPSLMPESEVDVVFEQPMVDVGMLGKPVDRLPFLIDPPIAGSAVWVAPEIVRWTATEVPTLGVEHVFSISGGTRHLDGSEVPAGKFGTLQAEDFNIRHASIRNRWSQDYSAAEAEFLIAFNDDVDPSEVAPFFVVRSGDGQEVATRVTRATAGQAGYLGKIHRRWADRLVPVGEAVTPGADDELPHVLIVAPERPLPVGSRWALLARDGLPNFSGSAMLGADRSFAIGDIQAFRIEEISARVFPDVARHITLQFNHNVPAELPDDFLTRVVAVEPVPENLVAVSEGRVIRLTGDFSLVDRYHVVVSAAFHSVSGHELAEPMRGEAVFERCTPVVMLPSGDQAQYAGGGRSYEVRTVNMASLRVRVKRLNGANLVRAAQGYRHYSGQGVDFQSISPTSPLPFGLLVGETLADFEITLENEVDTSETVTLRWDEILPDGHRHAALFLDIVGTPRADSGEARQVNSQALVQLTDIGLAWKLTDGEALVHAFSCETGAPLAGVRLALYGEDAVRIALATTDGEGLARLPRGGDARHLHASHGRDQFVSAWDRRLQTVGMWHFPVRVSWMPEPEEARRVMMFSDRPLYRPGETMRLKGIARTQRGNVVEGHVAEEARLVIADGSGRELLQTAVEISPGGSFDLEFPIPAGRTGWHVARLEFPAVIAAAAEIEDWWEREAVQNQGVFSHSFRVEEFRRNAFEATAVVDVVEPGDSAVTINLKASYFQGTPVAAGAVQGNTRVTATNFYPERFRDFQFGNHRRDDWRYWYHHFGLGDAGGGGDEASHDRVDVRLSPEGSASLTVDLPESEAPRTREVVFQASINDANNQFVTTIATATVHPADVYIGVSRIDRLVRAGQPLELRLIAATPGGEPFPGDVAVTATLSREVYLTTHVANARGEAVARNERTEEEIGRSEAIVRAAESHGMGHLIEITPESTGLHYLTVAGTDAAGRGFATTVRFHVYGENEFPWAYEEAMRIRLVAEKKQYQPGETARILVLSPIEGEAIVTVERENVLRSFRTRITMENPVVEIPLGEDDAPNVFASVLVIRGSADSRREHPEPQLRLGYCEIMVENVRDRLTVEFDHDPQTPHRPGQTIGISGVVSLADGSPAANAEVTLFAVDEGTLAVTGFKTPDPNAYFYNPRLLRVKAGTSFHNFLTENPHRRFFHNKGFFIGGGADGEEWLDNPRADFDPCATWAPNLKTDSNGRFNHSFALPDTLTRYRVMAVVHDGVRRFGVGESGLLVRKELMIEPMVPRFANEGDRLVPQVLVQNASAHHARWEVRAEVSGGDEAPIRLSGVTERTISLAPGASATIEFAAEAVGVGEARLVWSARPVSHEDGVELTPSLVRLLSDSVESVVPVHYPMPMVRQHRVVRLDAGASLDVRGLLDDRFTDATGTIEVDAAISPLVQAGESLAFLLQYPHGCLEQTTSGMMPWIAARELRTLIPALARYDDATIARTVQGAVDRILVMQQPDGSFSYWPGQRESVDWATPYAALGLALAGRSGAVIPESAVHSLHGHLIGSLRGLGEADGPDVLSMHARTLLALGIAGNGQPAYENRLLDRAGELPPEARSMLAAAIAHRGHIAGDAAALEAARALMMRPAAERPDDGFSWMRWAPDHALDLLAWATISPDSSETHLALDRLLKSMSPHGHWRTTWVNGWALIAIGEYARHHSVGDVDTHLASSGSGGDETFVLNSKSPSAARSYALTPGTVLTLTAGDAPVYLRLTASAKPALTPVSPVSHNGMSIERIYERVLADGTTEILDEPVVGDLVRVSLQVQLPAGGTRYLVVEDLLPSTFEAVHSDFGGQRAITGGRTSASDWRVSHHELRSDRACFYLDFLPNRGVYTLSYLARCTLAGEVVAPPAKVESMYDPENFALSASRVFRSR